MKNYYENSVKEGYTLKVFYLNGKKKVDMNASFKEGMISFKTVHFSTFVVMEIDPNAKRGLSTGGIILIVAGAIILVAGGVLAVMKLRKEKHQKKNKRKKALVF